jgi:hypothetical protein
MTEKSNPREAAAIAYAGLGWSVVPIARRSKRPLIAWTALQTRAADESEIHDWFRRWPGANIAVVTGALSGLVVLDIDPGHGGADSLAELEGRHGPLPDSVEAITGGGGRHLYFRHPGAVVHNRAGLAPGIDVRGDGGMVVAPPSVHPSGRTYEWKASHLPGTRPPAVLPAWLLAELRPDAIARGHPVGYWRELVRDGVPEGRRNNTVASLTGHLLWHGVDADVAKELLCCWNRLRCRPPLADEEVARTVDSIIKRHGGG